MRALRIAIVAAEVSPFSKAGGLADVAHALPKHVQKMGHDVAVVSPFYKFMHEQPWEKKVIGETTVDLGRQSFPVRFYTTQLSAASPVPVYFIDQAELFGNRSRIYAYDDDAWRYAVFNRAVFALFEALGYGPDIIHCHDWQTGLIPNYLRSEFSSLPLFEKTATLFTIHNLLFQMQGMWYETPAAQRDRGRGAPPVDPRLLRRTNFTLRGIKNADAINTVSERYAKEILTKKFGEGLDGVLRRRKERVFGIINGIDYTIFNPSFDPHLSIHYDWNSLDKKVKNRLRLQSDFGLPQATDTPLIGMAHRLTEQKGFNLVMDILPILMRLGVQLIVVGHGEESYLRFFRQMVKRYPQNVAVHLEFSEAVASRIYAGTDMFLMPSRYEPCGVSQLISLRYGSIPIVHHTGGLADTITDFDPRTGRGVGFVFHTYTGTDLIVALTRAIETFKYPKVWEHLTWQAMQKSFSWELPAQKYVELYKKATKYHALG